MIEKTVKIDGRDVKFKSSAALPRLYRIKFGRDLFVDMAKLSKTLEKSNEGEIAIESLELFENVAYLMNKYAEPDAPDNIDDWLEQFETFDVYSVLPEIIDLWVSNTKQLSTAKKKIGK